MARAWRQDWGEPADEPAIDPDRELIDPHHHLWPWRSEGLVPAGPYQAAEFLRDACGGHRIVGSVAVECGAAYHTDGPPELASTGETAFLAGQAEALAALGGRLAGIVVHVDLRHGAKIADIVEAHRAAAPGLVRGVRQMAAYDPGAPFNVSPVAGDLYADPGFRDGLRAVGAAGLVFDAWHYHSQASDFVALARDCPEASFVLDHYGTPLGSGAYAGREVFDDWRRGIAAVGRCPNVAVKVSGMTLPLVGAAWQERPTQPRSAEIAGSFRPWFDVLLESFGSDRCMFASNFPVEKTCVPYVTLWNSFKTLATRLSADETDALCRTTACRVYGLEVRSR